jgi:hypothetical protein
VSDKSAPIKSAKVRDRSPESSPDDIELSEAARLQLENAAAGNKDAAQEVEQIQKVDSPAVVAAEQEASDGPAGLGLAR